MKFFKRFSAIIIFTLYLFSYTSCVTSGAASAEEYFSIGMAYFEMGKFAEAEQWLNRARAADKTKTASEYNLGRIAFETGRYKDAIALFDKVLAKDPVNVMALKAAAYTRIKTGELEAAEKLYQRVLDLLGDSADDGYNYALVLYALKKYEAAEELIGNNQYALLENKDIILLYARTQKALGKVEAADSYAKWLMDNKDPKVRYEYAQVLEQAELYARALEECRTALTELKNDKDLTKGELRYAIARLIFIADGENPEGMTELKGAIADGYNDIEVMEELVLDERINADLRKEIKIIIDDAKRTGAEKAAAEKKTAEEEAAEGEPPLGGAETEAGVDGDN
ncbi:hypothetical protein FACS1894163_00540 [Spirochaetia bacterium]|nr:hypothetical protein FACS1894163_00540 [Spirochaetia bacterium]